LPSVWSALARFFSAIYISGQRADCSQDKSPDLISAVVLTLAVAISANAVVFASLNALALRPLDVPNPESREQP
jgi:hypothetical protein